MVCSLHSVTTGSRDRANVPLIIIIIIIIYFSIINNNEESSNFTIVVLFPSFTQRNTRL